MAAKKYRVNIDMVWSKDITIMANNKAEAKRKAFAKFKKTAKQKDFDFYAELRE